MNGDADLEFWFIFISFWGIVIGLIYYMGETGQLVIWH
jgi:hypothetical protein